MAPEQTKHERLKNKVNLDDLKNDYNWCAAFQYAGDFEPDADGHDQYRMGEPSVSACFGTDTPTDPVLRGDVTEIVASRYGEHDGDNWLIVVKLKDGRVAFLSAGCDYTGWDCQAGGHCIVDTDLQHLIRFGLGQDDRERLGLALTEEGSK